MANYEPHKMLSLKIAGLSKFDQNWILKQLPPESQKKIKASLKFVHKFNAANPEELAQQLMNDQLEDESKPPQATSNVFSHKFEAHLNAVHSGDIQLAPAAYSFVSDLIKESSDASD